MDFDEARQRMVLPAQPRPGKPLQGVIQIWVTHCCDRSCFGCTQASNIRRPANFISVEQFRTAVISLKDYFGVVGVFGGNPCLHPEFSTLCDILREYIPKTRCGLWANRLFGKADVCRKTFNPSVSNINVHMDHDSYNEIRRGWPEVRVFGLTEDSRHASPFVAIKDIVPDESQMWEMISRCDINRHWSALIGVFRGNLRAWFCEIAGSQSMLHQHDPLYPDTGIFPDPGWWRKGLDAFGPQIGFHCPSCGVPLRGRGELACAKDGKEQVSQTHASIYIPKIKGREVQIVTDVSQIGSVEKFTDYLGNAGR